MMTEELSREQRAEVASWLVIGGHDSIEEWAGDSDYEKTYQGQWVDEDGNSVDIWFQAFTAMEAASAPEVTSARLYEFFAVERRNEDEMRRQGDDPPEATLFTATDSLLQAPEDVLRTWFGLRNEPHLEAHTILMHEFLGLAWMVAQYGPHAKLKDFVFKE